MKTMMTNPTIKLDYNKLILKDGDLCRVISILDEADAEHYISRNVSFYEVKTGEPKPGEEVMLTSDVVCADKNERFFFTGRDWNFLKRYHLTQKALELVKDVPVSAE